MAKTKNHDRRRLATFATTGAVTPGSWTLAIALTVALAAGAALRSEMAGAAPVTVLDGGKVRTVDLAAVPDESFPPRPAPVRPLAFDSGDDASTTARSAKKKKKKRRDPVRRAVLAAERRGAITRSESEGYRRSYRLARGLHRKLGGKRKAELGSVLATLRKIAARGRLTSTRMPALFTILRRNHKWWNESPRIPRSGERIRFDGSRVIFQYYPGRGLQLQPLANFATANGYWGRGTPAANEALGELLDEMIALRSIRSGGFTTWEYYFPFGSGRPPWTSAISQGVAIQSLARASVRLQAPAYLEFAQAALGAFQKRTPHGVRVPAGLDGNWYALYSFSPGLRVLNAHLAAVNGLNDLAVHGLNEEARVLHQEGLRAARRRISAFDTGAWSKYASPGSEASLEYHKLNRDLAVGLCRRSNEEAICRAAENFRRYTSEPPRIGVIHTGKPKRSASTSISFFISKVSHVSVFVKRNGKLVRDAYATRGRGKRRIRFKAPSRPGEYRIDVLARDRAGNKQDRRGRLIVRR